MKYCFNGVYDYGFLAIRDTKNNTWLTTFDDGYNACIQDRMIDHGDSFLEAANKCKSDDSPVLTLVVDQSKVIHHPSLPMCSIKHPMARVMEKMMEDKKAVIRTML